MHRPRAIIQTATLALSGTRHAIDRVDDAMIALLGTRRRMVGVAATIKQSLGAPLRDADREQRVQERAQRLAQRWHVPPDSADRLMTVLIADACRQQARRDDPSFRPQPGAASGFAYTMNPAPSATTSQQHLLRYIPPPHYWRRPLALMPRALQARLIERVLTHALSASLQGSLLESIQQRRLGIEISDLGLHCVLELRDGQLHHCDEPAEATVRGTATDLLLLASRLEDADTLFFQRRLMLTGDTELGLTVRNLLDRMPWEALPLGLRIVLHRSGRFAQAARAAHQAHRAATAHG